MKKFKLLTSSAIVMTMVVGSIAPAFAYSKEETVYAKLKTDGSQKEVVVSEHLNNDTQDKTLNDVSTLKDIVNVNGNEKFTQDGKTITWQTTDGNDIYYQGNTDEELPVTMNISYKLNGKETKLKDMLGKKGNVEIQIDYTNQEKRTVDGEELYVPFIITAGTMLSTKTDSNIEVTNGKVISNGSNNIVAAIAAPGLSENYNNNEELAKLNSITIKYTTTKFKLNSIMSVASPSLLSETDLDFGDLNSLYDNVDKLTSSYSQIIDGGKKLQAGANQVKEKMVEVVSATKQLENGSNQLATGVDQLSSGSDTLVNGINQLDTGAKKLYAGIQSVNQAIQQLSMGASQLDNGLTALNIASNGGTYVDASGNAVAIDSMINNANKIAGVTKELQSYSLSAADIEYLKTKLDPNDANDQQILSKIESLSNTAANSQSQLAKTTQDLYVSSSMVNTVNSQLAQGIEQLKQGLAQLSARINETSGNESTLLNGAKQLSNGITQLKDKAPALTTGIDSLDTGVHQLSTAMAQLSSGSQQLKTQGTDALADGMDSLVSGMVQFQDEGLNKISDVLTNTVKNDVNKTEKLIQLSKEYKTFTGVKDDVEATTKFVMIVDAKSKK